MSEALRVVCQRCGRPMEEQYTLFFSDGRTYVCHPCDRQVMIDMTPRRLELAKEEGDFVV